MNAEILAKLQRHQEYQGWRIRPYPINPAVFLAETYIWLGRGNKKGWRALRYVKRGDYRTSFTWRDSAFGKGDNHLHQASRLTFFKEEPATCPAH